MMVSTRGRYALRVLVDLAENKGDGYVTLQTIADRQEISEKYLESIVRDLVRRKFIEGVRGKGGGYRLAHRPDEISVLEVLRCMEGTLVPVACLEEDAKPCPRAAAWASTAATATSATRRTPTAESSASPAAAARWSTPERPPRAAGCGCGAGTAPPGSPAGTGGWRRRRGRGNRPCTAAAPALLCKRGPIR